MISDHYISLSELYVHMYAYAEGLV